MIADEEYNVELGILDGVNYDRLPLLETYDVCSILSMATVIRENREDLQMMA